jgi:hypothetical protein
MKSPALLTLCFSLTIWVFVACKKDSNETDNPSAQNSKPIARAGADQTITLTECHGDSGVTLLDGSSSTDPDGNLKTYTWRRVSGRHGPRLKNPIAAKAELTHLSIGEYVYELTVQDEKLLLSKDSVKIVVKGVAKEYDLDVTFDMSYTFRDDYSDCGWDWPDYPCPHDVVESGGGGTFAPLGKLWVVATELTEAVNNSNVVYYNHIGIRMGDEAWISGAFNINLKRLIIQGGGAFSGEIRVQAASAQSCTAGILTNLRPLIITGTLDPTIKTMRARVRGKVYF